jgi:hypothetical protein
MAIERIKTPMAKILGTKFIEIIIHKTMYRLQEIVINYMIEKPTEINIIAAALDTIKHDTTLHERALIAYDLSKCDESIRAKYMPLVMV